MLFEVTHHNSFVIFCGFFLFYFLLIILLSDPYWAAVTLNSALDHPPLLLLRTAIGRCFFYTKLEYRGTSIWIRHTPLCFS